MSTIRIRVKLKTYDLVSGTALSTLKEDLEWKGIIEDLSREEIWEIRVNKSKEEAKKLGEEFTKRVKIFVNPNKHLWEVKVFEKEEKEIIEEDGKGTYLSEILTWWINDAKEKSALKSLRNTWGYKGVLDVKRYDLWKLKLKAESSSKALAYIKDIIVTEKQDKGLLINPHSQCFKIISLLKL